MSQGQEMRSGEDLAKENLPQKTSLSRQGEKEEQHFGIPMKETCIWGKKKTPQHSDKSSYVRDGIEDY